MNEVFHAVADAHRRQVLVRLRQEGALSISELCEPVSISRQAMTKHLDILVRAGLVRSEWHGRERRHLLQSRRLRAVQEWLAPFAAEWDRRLARLEKYLQEVPESPAQNSAAATKTRQSKRARRSE